MPSTYYPSKDAELVVWLGNFITVANANLAALGIVATDVDPIKALQPTYSTNLNDVETKKAALSASVETKDATKDSIIQKIRLIVNKIQANPAVTPSLKAQLGISTRTGSTNLQHPVAPSDLVAELQSDGSVNLTWNRNANAPRTQFVIESIVGNGTEWSLLDVVTRTNYTHQGIGRGEQIMYRIKARKGNETSGCSNLAIVNAD